jgi:hypothetical protein
MTLFADFANSDDNKKDSFRKNAIIKNLGEITNELRAIELRLDMKPFEPYPNVKTSDKVEVVYSKVKIDYKALTDITAFKILKLISEKLKGTVYYKGFTLKKNGEIDSDVLLRISEGNFPNLVQGEIEFDWISIRMKDGVKLEIPKLPAKQQNNLPQAAPAAPQAAPAAPQVAPAAPQAAPQNPITGGQDV